MTIPDSARDDEIVAAAISGNDEAFSTLYDLLSGRVFNLVLRSVHERATAEDICQEIWLKAHREIRSLKSPQALRTWLFRLASRACIDYSRSKACRERQSPEVSEEMLNSPADEPEVVAMRKGELRLMWEVLAALPARQSMALYLKQVDGCTYDEIGRILGCPKSAVETLLFRARHGLVRMHERFQADPKANCKMIGVTMSVVLDQEGTAIQQRAVEMHLADCKPCREELTGMKRGVAGYAVLPMLPVGGQALSIALAGGTAGTGLGFGIARIVGMLLVNGKASGLVALTVGAITVTSAGAAAGLTPSPLDAFDAMREVSTVARDGAIGSNESDTPAGLPAADTVARPPPQAPIQPLPAAPVVQAGQSAPAALPPASQLDATAALSGLPGLLQGASNGALASVGPLLAFVDETLAGVLADPLGTLTQLLTNPVATLDDLSGTATEAVNQTTQNTTTSVDTTVDQTTDIVDGLLGENELTSSLDETVDNTTGVVDETVGDVTGMVGETTGGLGETLDDLLGDDGLLSSDDGLLDDLLGGANEEEEPPCIPILFLTCD
ncbi:MAG TPA: sigma-70 family RNA polymerase sigma factor [Dehalococcoidia bacterium]|nr:sigma-70 family RNA polymerase sigma factor [Dehalococcoidia bacterium]